MTVVLGHELKEEVDFFKSGLPSLDNAIGGGIPKGRVVEIFGKESTCKTALALSIIASAQKQGLKCLFADVEQAFNFTFAEKLGVDIKKLLFIKTEFGYGEEWLEGIVEVVKDKKANVIVLDSVDACTPMAKLQSEVLTGVIGIKAKMFNDFCRKILFELKKNNITLILINQTRINFFTSQESTPGGDAIRFYSSVRIKLRQLTATMRGDEVIGKKITATILKNKVGTPGRVVECNFLFDGGFSETADLADIAIAGGHITKEKTTFYFNGLKLGIGINKVREFLTTHPEVVEEIKARL